MPEKKIIVRGVKFTRQVFVRDDGTFVQVSNSLYGSTERRITAPIDLEALSHHMAMELVKSGPKSSTESFPQDSSPGGYDSYDTAPEKQ